MEKITDKPEPYLWLDLIRGLAALAVFLGHLRVICIKDMTISNLDTLGKTVFFLTGFSHLAVMIFFVLSGFLIIKSIDQSYLKGSFSIGKYLINRLTRLWVVLLPCLIIGYIFDSIGLAYLSDTLFYSNEFRYFFHKDLASRLSLPYFVGNLLFLQNILVPTYGSNDATWTLANEFWYYILFPIIYIASLIRKKIILRLALIALTIAILYFVGQKIATYFIVWLFGGLSYFMLKYISNEKFQKKAMRYLVTLVFLGFIVMLRSKRLPMIFNNFSVGLTFSFLIIYLTQITVKNHWLKKISIFLSNISYTLYLAHLPFIYLTTSIFRFQEMSWNIQNFIIMIAFALATLIYAYGLWYFFERNTNHVKRYVMTNFYPGARDSMKVSTSND